jgi:hypothetical protein
VLRHPRAAPAALAAALAAAVALAGCGLGPGATPARVSLTITDGFGTHVLRDLRAPQIQGQDTVIRLLERNAHITTRYGGGFVQSIDGRAGGVQNGRPIDWFYYVNGIEASAGAAGTRVHAADRVWWDRHDWGAAMSSPAVVGSFPEPFAHGSGGRRFPVRVECEHAGDASCRAVADRLAALGVPAGQSLLGAGPARHILRVLVGTWAALRGDPAAAAVERGPSSSGVYARPARSGRSLGVLDPSGHVVRVLGAGTGLVAATRTGDADPVWLVTGTDPAGVAAAAGAFDEGDLHARFAVAVAGGRREPLPEVRG